MNRLFFDDQTDGLYDCSKYSPDEWRSFGHRSRLIGILYMTTGFVYDLLYLPVLAVMLQQRFFHRSCYRIMLFLGVLDFTCVIINSIIDGYFAFVGAIYCTHPIFMYVVGCISTALWAASCATCYLLAFNRCLTITRPKLAEKLFGGHRTELFLCLPAIYALYFCFFTKPALFSSNYYASFFNPYVGIAQFDVFQEEEKYANLSHTINNVADVLLLCCTYVAFCIYIAKAASTQINGVTRQTFIQASVICSINATASVIYVVMQFVPTPPWLIIVGQVAWQASHGVPVFIYLFLNRSIKNAIRRMILRPRQSTVSFTGNGIIGPATANNLWLRKSA